VLNRGHSVFQCNPDQVQGRHRLSRETLASCRNIGVSYSAHQPNVRVAQCRHDQRDVVTSYLRAIFITGLSLHTRWERCCRWRTQQLYSLTAISRDSILRNSSIVAPPLEASSPRTREDERQSFSVEKAQRHVRG